MLDEGGPQCDGWCPHHKRGVWVQTEHGTDSPPEPPEGTSLATVFISESSLQNRETTNLCSLKPPSLWYLYGSLRTRME